jgi:hypothetical protein
MTRPLTSTGASGASLPLPPSTGPPPLLPSGAPVEASFETTGGATASSPTHATNTIETIAAAIADPETKSARITRC